MSFEEQARDFKIWQPTEADIEILKKTKAPNTPNMTWEELYEHAAKEEGLEPGEDFSSFVKRIRNNQEENDDEPENPIRNAA
jgi:hypothetical protein